jgi:hypothetical protein
MDYDLYKSFPGHSQHYRDYPAGWYGTEGRNALPASSSDAPYAPYAQYTANPSQRPESSTALTASIPDSSSRLTRDDFKVTDRKENKAWTNKKSAKIRKFKVEYVNERVLKPDEEKFLKGAKYTDLLEVTNQHRIAEGNSPLVENPQSRYGFDKQLTGKAWQHAFRKGLEEDVEEEEWGPTYGISDSDSEPKPKA